MKMDQEAIRRVIPHRDPMCGRQAIDGDTAQVGPQIAEKLHLPQVTYAADIQKTGDTITVKRMLEDGYMKGNIAPEGSVLKYSACAKKQREVVNAVARVFNCEEDAHDAVVNNQIDPGEVVIIRYEGPRGCGMPEMLMTTEAIVCDERINGSVALITDGRFSGATRGAAIGHESVVGNEGALRFSNLTKLPIEIFNGIGGIDQLSNFRRVFKHVF